MELNLDITYNDKAKKLVVCNAADLVAFEDKFDMSAARLSSEPRVGWMLYLAWHSEKRTEQTDLEFDKWLSTVKRVGGSDTDPKSEG